MRHFFHRYHCSIKPCVLFSPDTVPVPRSGFDILLSVRWNMPRLQLFSLFSPLVVAQPSRLALLIAYAHYIIFVSTSTLISHKTYNYCSTILTFYIGLILLFLDMKLPSYRTFIFHCPIMRVVYQVEHILFYLLFLSDRYSFNHTAISPFSRLPQ